MKRQARSLLRTGRSRSTLITARWLLASQTTAVTASRAQLATLPRAPEEVVSDTQTLIENRPPSVATLFLERVAATPDREAYRYPVPPPPATAPTSGSR